MAATTVTAWAQLVHRALEQAGADPDGLFEQAGLDPSALREPGARYSFLKVQELWRLAEATTGDPDFGLAAARCWHPTSWHALGYAWLASETLLDAFERTRRYARLVTDSVSIELEPSPHGIWVVGHLRPGLPMVVRPAQDVGLATVVMMCRLSRGPQFRPLCARFAYPRPASTEALERFFEAPCEFDAEVGGLEIASDDLEAPLPSANAELARTNEQVIVDYLDHFDATTVAQRARCKLLEQLPSGHACEASVARELNMSSRTLQRRLRAEGTTFRDILDDVRRELAIRYLTRRELSINEITYILGFVEPSSFTRAFRRWTGSCPTVYRDAARAADRSEAMAQDEPA